jgi:hypothetical protein
MVGRRDLLGVLSVTTETPEEDVMATGDVARVGWDVKASAAHDARAAAALIEHNVPLSAIMANETPLIQNVSIKRRVKKEHTWLWTSTCATSTSP